MTTVLPPWSYTVVIPAFNAAPWIADAIVSALRQDPAPVEVIVVDDGSTDATASIAEAHPTVRVVRQPNGGEATARNTGLRAARTPWVSFLDADDRFLPYRHRWIAEHLARHPDHAVVAADALIEVGGAIRGTHFAQTGIHFAQSDQRRQILDANFLLSHVVCDRDRLLALGGFDEALSHACDWDMWIRFVLDGGTIGLIDAPLSVYRRHDAAMTADLIRVARGDLAVLSKTATLPQLTADERRHVNANRAAAQALLERDEMKQAVLTNDGTARRRARDIATSHDQPVSARVKAATVALAPNLHRWLLRRRDRRRPRSR